MLVRWQSVVHSFTKGGKFIEFFLYVSKLHSGKDIVIDLKRITDVDINFLRGLFNQLKSNEDNIDIVFLRCEIRDFNELVATAGFITNYNTDKTIIAINTSDLRNKKHQLEKISTDYLFFIEKKVTEYITDTFGFHKKNDSNTFELLLSTPLLANGEFDASKILLDPKKFLLITTYASDILEDFLLEMGINNTNNTKLLAVSLRSAPFASGLSQLLGYDFVTIDHLGPNHKLFNIDFNQKVFDKSQYVYVGDFLVGGSEIRIAQNYIQFMGGVLNHAFVLGSYLENSDNRFKGKFDYKYLVGLKNAVPDFKIQF
jgi:hypothetical protein